MGHAFATRPRLWGCGSGALRVAARVPSRVRAWGLELPGSAVPTTTTQEAALRSHCGGQRYPFNWGLALVTAVMNQRKAEASYARRGRSAHAVGVVVGLQPADIVEPDEERHRVVVGGKLQGRRTR